MSRFAVSVTISVLSLLLVGFALGVLLAPSLPFGPAANGNSLQQLAPQIITVPVLVTATIDPDASFVVVVTSASPQSGGQSGGTALPGLAGTPAAASAINAEGTEELIVVPYPVEAFTEGLPAGCILHELRSGDTPYALAGIYGADPFDLLEINSLTEDTARFLRVGDKLVVPVNNCPMTPEQVQGFLSGEWTVDDLASPAPRVTITLPPTAVAVQLEISRIVGAGDITAEGVEIRNLSDGVDLQGWTLEDGAGNVFTFPQQRLFAGGQVMVFTRSGNNTPNALYQGMDAALWQATSGVAMLRNADGELQATFSLADSSAGS